MTKRGRPPVMKAWRVRITQPDEEPLEFTIFAETLEEAEEMARFWSSRAFLLRATPRKNSGGCCDGEDK